jgi:hypothetical protein
MGGKSRKSGGVSKKLIAQIKSGKFSSKSKIENSSNDKKEKNTGFFK